MTLTFTVTRALWDRLVDGCSQPSEQRVHAKQRAADTLAIDHAIQAGFTPIGVGATTAEVHPNHVTITSELS